MFYLNPSAKARSPIDRPTAHIPHEIQDMGQSVRAILAIKSASLLIYSFFALTYPALLPTDPFYFFNLQFAYFPLYCLKNISNNLFFIISYIFKKFFTI